jgi:hypothetical protein
MSAPVIDSEAIASGLARDWRLQVDTAYTGATGTTPTWVTVKGLTNFTPTVDSTKQDDASYDNDGWGSSTKTMQAWSNTGTVKRGKSVSTGNYDIGQEKIRDAADKFGLDGVVHIRWYTADGGPEAYEGYADVSWTDAGGDTSALRTANFTLDGKGSRVEIANPTAAG